MSDTITTAELAALKARYADPDFHPDTLRRITAYECPRLIAALEVARARITELEAMDLWISMSRAVEEADSLRQQLAEARAELNPVCADESLLGAIRNLRQAHITERDNCEKLEQQLTTAQARIAELKAQLDEANFEAARQRHACAEAKAELEQWRKQEDPLR